MLTCIICHFETELDDAAVAPAAGRCVCLRCFGRETGSELRMPRALRLALTQTLDSIGAA